MQWNGASCCKYDGKSVENESATWSEFPNEGKATVVQILVLEERNKKAGLWDSQSGIGVGKLTIKVRSSEIEKIITEFTRSISSTRIDKPVLMMNV